MSGPRDGFKKIHRACKTRDEIACKNLDYFDLIEDSEDEEGSEDSDLDDEDEDQ